MLNDVEDHFPRQIRACQLCHEKLLSLHPNLIESAFAKMRKDMHIQVGLRRPDR